MILQKVHFQCPVHSKQLGLLYYRLAKDCDKNHSQPLADRPMRRTGMLQKDHPDACPRVEGHTPRENEGRIQQLQQGLGLIPPSQSPLRGTTKDKGALCLA